MALTGTDRGVGGNNTTGLTIAIVPASNLTAGALAVLVLAYDNSATGGADPYVSIADNLGNTWTSRQNALYDPGAAAAGVTLRIFTTPQDVGTLTTGSTITVTFSPTTVAKAWTLMEFTGSVGKPEYQTGGKNTGSATGAPTVTTSSIPNATAVVGAGGSESTNAWVGDADTSNGSWSTQQTAGYGTGTSGMAVTSQRKIVTATAAQTYNPTQTSADCILAWISVGENITVTPSKLALVISTYIPTITVSQNILVTPSTLAHTITLYAPSAILGTVVIPDLVALAITTYAPTIEIAGGGTTVTPDTINLVLALFAPTIIVSNNITVIPNTTNLATALFAPGIVLGTIVIPNVIALNLTPLTPSIIIGIVIIPNTITLTTATYIPTIVATANITITPSPLALILSTFAPSIAALILTTYAPYCYSKNY